MAHANSYTLTDTFLPLGDAVRYYWSRRIRSVANRCFIPAGEKYAMSLSRNRLLARLTAPLLIFAAVTAANAQDNQPANDTTPNSESTANAVTGELSPIEAAIAFAEALTADATTTLTDETATEAEKLSRFQGILAEGLALEVIGKFMIGEHRKTMSEEQINRYKAIFPDYITRLYAEQFQDIVGRPLVVIEAKTFGSRDVVVRTRFDRTDGEPITVDWRVRKLRSGSLKMIDIIVRGVSIMLVKREEFSAFIAANGVDALIGRLEEEAGA